MKTISQGCSVFLLLLVFTLIAHGASDESNEINFSTGVTTNQNTISSAGFENFGNSKESDTLMKSVSIIVDTDPQINDTFGTLTLLTPLSTVTSELAPRISGDYVIWSGYGNNSYDIFLYQLSNGRETNLTPDWKCQIRHDYPYPGQEAPAIDESYIVWQDSRNINWDIFLCDLLSGDETQITKNTDESNQLSPDISGDRIVWSDDRSKGYYEYDIFLFNITTGEEILLSPTMPDVSLENPHISGDYVVCEGYDLLNGTYDVYLCDLQSITQNGSWVLLTPDSPYSDQKNPDISGDYVVWDGFDELNGTLDVFIHNISCGSTYLLTNDTPESNQKNPSIYHNKVVWEDSWLREEDMHDIVLYDLYTGSLTLLTPDASTDQILPDIFGNRIVWQGKTSDWTWDVYLFTLDIKKTDLNADFSANVSGGKSPLIVAFNDTSSGEPEFWYWDFGDGNNSNQQNPVHSYDAPGTYGITLSTGNPYQRDRERKGAFISAGAEPVCRFSAEPVSGVTPLIVQFYDLSSGDPETWLWDFGDGNTSDLKNPVYAFNNQGTYNISLTVTNPYGTGTLREDDLIMVVNATDLTMIFDIPGLSIEQIGINQGVNLEGNVSPPFVITDFGQKLIIYPPDSSGIYEMVFEADTGGFSRNGNTVMGTLSSVCINSQEIPHYPRSIDHGSIGIFNYTVCSKSYPVQETLDGKIWEGAFPGDYQNFDKALDNYPDYGDIQDIAYTLTFDSSDFEGCCTIIAGIDATWVQNFGKGDNGTIIVETTPPDAAVYIDSVYRGKTPMTVTALAPGEHQIMLNREGYTLEKRSFRIRDERNSIKIIRVGDDGSAEVLNTTFLYHDSVLNLDYFQAHSPHGLSKYAVSALGGPGNPFQMIYLSISQTLKPKTSGGGGLSSGSVAGAGLIATSAPTQTPGVVQTPKPTTTSSATGSETGTTDLPIITQSHDSGNTPVLEELPIIPNGGGQEGTSAMVLLKNLAVVAVVIIVTIVFYFRWKKKVE